MKTILLVLAVLLCVVGCKDRNQSYVRSHIRHVYRRWEPVTVVENGQETVFPGVTTANSTPLSPSSSDMVSRNYAEPNAPDLSPACHCDPEALQLAVIDRLDQAGLIAYGNDRIVGDGTKASRQAQRVLRIKLEQWAKTLQDRCLREKYLYMIDLDNEILEQAESREGKPLPKDSFDVEQEKSEKCKRDGTVPRISLTASKP